MTIDDYINRLKEAQEILVNRRPEEALIIAFDLLALIKSRIQGSGLDYEDNAFLPYTIGYAKERTKKGFQVGFVDFTRSGRMWSNTRPEIVSNNESITVVEIKGGNNLTKDILRGQARKRGNILRPTIAEERLVAEANLERVKRALGKLI